MDPLLIGIIGIIALLVLLLIGMNIGISMAIVGFVGFTICTNLPAAIGMLKTVPFNTAANFGLSVIPLFVLMGQFAFYSGLSEDLFATCYKWLGRLPGGLACSTIAACAGFAAICGSSTATTATLGVVCLPEMRKYGYKDELSCGCIASGGTLGILIPPSVGFILYGIMAEQSVGSMFAAGILPGIMLAIFYIIAIVIWVKKNPALGPKGPVVSFVDKMKSLKGIIGIIILFIIVLGGIFSGVFTANEGAAIGAFGSFIYMMIKRKATVHSILKALGDTIRTSAMIFLIMIGAFVFGYFLTVSGLPASIATAAMSADVPGWVIIFIILLVYAILGCFVDSLPLITLLVPIFLPIVINLGFDPIWFGVLMVMVMQLGLITPPVGMCVYVMGGIAKDVKLATIFKGVIPFIVALVIASIIVAVIPQLSLFLPHVMYGL